MHLINCDECQRHVKADARARGEPCPFCGAAASADTRSHASSFAPEARARDRSVLLFGAAAVASALAVSACGKESDGHGGGMVMPYGAPIPTTPDASMPEPRASATNPEVPKDAGASPMPLAPAYGGPPPPPSGKK